MTSQSGNELDSGSDDVDMEDNTRKLKIKKRKTVESGSEDDEVLVKHKTGDLEEVSQKNKNYLMGSAELNEKKQNGRYQKPTKDNMSNSDSGGTDVELTSDDELPEKYNRSKKKRKTKNERNSRNSVQLSSSSESEDEIPSSPKAQSSNKKSYRKRRTSGNKSLVKNSTDSESYKTDSESDEESSKRKLSKGSVPLQNRHIGKDSSNKMMETNDTKIVDKKNVNTDNSSDSEDNAPLQKLRNEGVHSSSSSNEQIRAARKSVLHKGVNSSKNQHNSKEVVDKGTESSSDECLASARAQGMKEMTEDNDRKNSGAAENFNMAENSDDSDSDHKMKGKKRMERSSSETRPKEKKIKLEENSSDSGSELSDNKNLLKDKKKIESSDTKKRPSSPSSSGDRKKRRSNSSSGSASEEQKKEKRQRNKLPDEDKRIISLKKYLKTAGIRVQNYSELWKDCRSNKARAEKLVSLLEKNGLKGRPTIEKCKKLRKKIETKKEVAELDLGNVMNFGGRSRRIKGETFGPLQLPDEVQQRATEIKERFARLRAICGSDSDSD